jgi:hypothetical protein
MFHNKVRVGQWFAQRGAVDALAAAGALVLTLACQSAADSDEAKEVAKAKAEAEAAKSELADLKAKAAVPVAVSVTPPAAAGTSVGAPGTASSGAASSGTGLSGATPAISAPSVAGGSLPPGQYSLDLIKAMPDDCKSPSLMLAAVPNAAAQKEDFVWAFAVQALYAHSDFKLSSKAALSKKDQVAFEDVAVNPTATGLIAYCHDGATCNRLAAMYKTTVPSSKPEVYCGKKWEPGQPSRGFSNAADLTAMAKKKLKDEPGSMCARIGVCTKQQNPAAAGDPGVECQRAPTEFKYQCAQKESCEAVVACTQK